MALRALLIVITSYSIHYTKLYDRRRFDLFRVDVASRRVEPIALRASGDIAAAATERRSETSATSVAFTSDGKQIAFVRNNFV